jgi:hypothetical protein
LPVLDWRESCTKKTFGIEHSCPAVLLGTIFKIKENI